MSSKIKFSIIIILSFVWLLFTPSQALAVNLNSYNLGSTACTDPCTVSANWSTDANSWTAIYISTATLPLSQSIAAYGGPYGANVNPGIVTVTFPTPGTYSVWIAADGYNQNGTDATWVKSVVVSAPVASPVPTPTPAPAASSSPSSNNNNSNSNNNSSPAPTPTPSPTIRPTYHPTPTPSLLPSPDASGSAVLGVETGPSSSPQVAGGETENNGINPLFVVIPAIGLGLGLLAWVFKDKLSASMAQQMANRKRARLEKMITSKQEVSEEPLN